MKKICQNYNFSCSDCAVIRLKSWFVVKVGVDWCLQLTVGTSQLCITVLNTTSYAKLHKVVIVYVSLRSRFLFTCAPKKLLVGWIWWGVVLVGAIDLLSTFGANDTGQFLVFEQLFSLRKNLMNFCIYEVNRSDVWNGVCCTRWNAIVEVWDSTVGTPSGELGDDWVI